MDDKKFRFWQKWLLIVSIFFAVMGLIIALLPGGIMFHPHIDSTAELFFGGPIPEEAENLRTFLFGIIGGTVAGYFLLQIFIVRGPFQRREPWAWHAILWAMLLWFVIDSTLSISHGAFFNVWMINIWTLVLVGLPLMMTRKYFPGKEINQT